MGAGTIRSGVGNLPSEVVGEETVETVVDALLLPAQWRANLGGVSWQAVARTSTRTYLSFNASAAAAASIHES